jgi:hypothetical protein
MLLLSTNTVPVNQWTHVAATDDGSTIKVYLNGQLEDQAAFPYGIFREPMTWQSARLLAVFQPDKICILLPGELMSRQSSTGLFPQPRFRRFTPASRFRIVCQAQV